MGAYRDQVTNRALPKADFQNYWFCESTQCYRSGQDRTLIMGHQVTLHPELYIMSWILSH